MGDTNRFSHTKILPWHQLRLQPEPKKHAFNFNPACSWVREYATNWNTIQPCLPSSKPWYSPEKINHSIPAPKTHKKRFRLGGNPGKKPVDHCRPENLPPFHEAIPHLVSPRFRWTLKPAPSSGRWEGWPAEIWSFECPPFEGPESQQTEINQKIVSSPLPFDYIKPSCRHAIIWGTGHNHHLSRYHCR